MTIWLTRPHEDSKRMADMLAHHGIASLMAPLMEIEAHPVTWPAEKPDALLLTSRYGAASIATMPPSWRDLTTYCTGPATALIAQRSGFTRVFGGSGGVVDLLPKIRVHQKPGTRLLYPCGEDIKLDVGPLLEGAGITVERLTAYTARAITALPPKLLAAFDDIQGVILVSARAARIAHQLLQAHGLLAQMGAKDIYCLSLDIAAEAAPLGAARVYTCAMPTYEAMMELLSQHAKKAA